MKDSNPFGTSSQQTLNMDDLLSRFEDEATAPEPRQPTQQIVVNLGQIQLQNINPIVKIPQMPILAQTPSQTQEFVNDSLGSIQFPKTTSQRQIQIAVQSIELSSNKATMRSIDELFSVEPEDKIKSLEQRVLELEASHKQQQTLIQSMSKQIEFLLQQFRRDDSFFAMPAIQEESNDKSLSTKGKLKSSTDTLSRKESQMVLSQRLSKGSSVSQSKSYKKQNSGKSSSPKLQYQHSNVVDDRGWERESEDSDEPQEQVSQQIDIAFLHSQVLVYQNERQEIKSMNIDQELSAGVMYQQLIEKLQAKKKAFNVYNRGLTSSILLDVLVMKPAVLFINCHGGFYHDKSTSQNITYLCFEDESQPTLMRKFTEANLKNLVKANQVQLVVISACHSSQFAKVLVEVGVPAVVSISASDKVLEKAAEAFNKEFLDYILKGKSPQQAFDLSLAVLSSDSSKYEICCCQHDHAPDCLWVTYKEQHGDYEAHRLHASNSCNCSGRKDFSPIDHIGTCAHYGNFYNKMVGKSNKKIETVLNNKNEGFLKMPSLHLNAINKMCCCASFLSHSESQKFMINGSEKGLQTPIFDLSRRPEGDVFEDLPIDYKNLPQWLRKESNWLYDRNIEINDIVTFLIGTKRLLTVVGEQSSGRTAVITKAIKIVMARNGSKFRDGVFEVDLENIGMPSIIKKISDTLGLSNPFPKEDSLIRDLIKKDLLIVFTDCQMTSRKKTQLEILKLIQTIILQTSQDERLKFVVMMNEKHSDTKYDQEQILRIEQMSRNGKVRLFIHYMKNENKGHLFTANEDQIRSHPIFDVVGPFNISKIAMHYKSIDSLDEMQAEIMQSLQKSRSSNQSNRSFKKGGQSDNNLRLRSLFCSDLLQSVTQECCQEKNLVFFLCLTPAGITQTEITQLTKIYKKWFGCRFKILDRLQQEPHAVNSSVLTEQEGNYLDLLEFNKIQDLEDQIVVKINRDYLSGLELVLDHAELELRSDKELQKQKRKDLLSICIEFMGSQARSILRSLRRKERSGAADYRLVTAHLDCGMWWRYPNEEESFDEEIALAEQRFSQFYLTNFRYLLDESMLLMNFKELWGDKLSQESEYIFDLCLTVPSILVQLNRYQEAEDLIKHCRSFGKGKTLLLHGYLDLMLASIYVHNNSPVAAQLITRLLDTARKTFQQFHHNSSDDLGHIEGRAECFFVEALLHMQVFKNIIQQPQHALKSQTTMPLHQSEALVGIGKRIQTLYLQEAQCIHVTSITDHSKIIKQIEDALKEAFQCFEQIDDEFEGMSTQEPAYNLSNKPFGKAKTIIAEADFYINFYKEIFKQDLEYSGFDRKDQLKKLERAKDILHDRARRASGLKKHSSYEAGLLNKSRTSKNLEALTICLQAQLQMLHVSEKNIDDIICARTIIDKAMCLLEDVDDNMAQTIRNVKNKVLDEMRSYSHNLFTFAKAWPLVEKDHQGQIRSIGEFPTSRFELSPKIELAFHETGLDLQIKFDFLNADLIRSVADSGSCVLHISSDIFDKDSLYLEDKIGIALRIPIDELSTYFQQFKVGNQFKNNRLPVDCVVLAMPDSVKIGQKFSEMGVKHVVAFKLTASPHSEIESQLMPIRYNYIYTFCQKFYIALVKQVTVREAFNLALARVNDQRTLDMKIWQMREFKERDLGIKPVLMDYGNEKHNKKLFDTTCHHWEREYIKQGPLYNVSKARGLLVGMKKAKDPYIGHKIELHHAMAALTNQETVTRLCHIKGKRGMGKTRFLQEVAYYLYQRGMFSFKIQYQDLQHIKTEQAFKDMLQEKSLYDEQRITLHTEKTLLVFDNIDSLLPKLAKWFESRLMDLTQNNQGLRFLTSSTKAFTFEHFQKVDVGCKQLGDSKDNKMILMHLKPLNDLQTVDLLLSLCPREITRQELDMEDDNPNTVHKQLQLEQNVTALENRPRNIVELAKRLEKAQFREIRVKVQQDEKKHLPVHHTAKSVGSTVQFSYNNKNSSASKESKEPKPEVPIMMQQLQHQPTWESNHSLYLLNSETGETSDYGRSRQGSFAVNGFNFDQHTEEVIRRLGPIFQTKQSVMSNIEDLTSQLQHSGPYLEVPDGQSDAGSQFSGRSRILSNATDEKYAEAIIQVNKMSKPPKLHAKKHKKKKRNVDRFRKQKKIHNKSNKSSDDEDTPVKSTSSPSDVTETDVPKKKKKVTKLTKQEREELEWEQQKKH